MAPDERGIVLRFGRVVREVDPGPGYHLPWPFEQVMKPAVTRIYKEEFGFRTVDVGPPARYRDVDVEALMLTGDENIVKLQFIVQFKVKTGPTGATDFLFNVRDARHRTRSAEAAMHASAGPRASTLRLTEQTVQRDAQVLLQQISSSTTSVSVVTVKVQDVDPPNRVWTHSKT